MYLAQAVSRFQSRHGEKSHNSVTTQPGLNQSPTFFPSIGLHCRAFCRVGSQIKQDKCQVMFFSPTLLIQCWADLQIRTCKPKFRALAFTFTITVILWYWAIKNRKGELGLEPNTLVTSDSRLDRKAESGGAVYMRSYLHLVKTLILAFV